MREWALVAQSFLPFAARFLSRHPTKLGRLRAHWQEYRARSHRMAALTGRERAAVDRLFYELECEEPLFRSTRAWTGMPMHAMVYYVLVRLVRPEVVVETGVCEGLSSLFILRAMERNGQGILHSIDLPNGNEDLGPGLGRQVNVIPNGRESGWMVPASLRSRWHLHLGDARVLLPSVLQDVGAIDIFIHDSLHAYDHMLFEFNLAWQHLRSPGFLLSDDTDWNAAFQDFSERVQRPGILFNYRVGAIRKTVVPLG